MSDALGFRIETPTVTEPPAEAWRKVLSDAADYIEAHGWWDGRKYIPDTVCAIQATARVTGNWPLSDLADERLAQFLNIGDSSCEVADWNDTPGRTATEVCAALRSCAVQP